MFCKQLLANIQEMPAPFAEVYPEHVEWAQGRLRGHDRAGSVSETMLVAGMTAQKKDLARLM